MLSNFQNEVVLLVVDVWVRGEQCIVDLWNTATLWKLNVNYGAENLTNLSFASHCFFHSYFPSLLECFSSTNDIKQLAGDTGLSQFVKF